MHEKVLDAHEKISCALEKVSVVQRISLTVHFTLEALNISTVPSGHFLTVNVPFTGESGVLSSASFILQSHHGPDCTGSKGTTKCD